MFPANKDSEKKVPRANAKGNPLGEPMPKASAAGIPLGPLGEPRH